MMNTEMPIVNVTASITNQSVFNRSSSPVLFVDETALDSFISDFSSNSDILDRILDVNTPSTNTTNTHEHNESTNRPDLLKEIIESVLHRLDSVEVSNESLTKDVISLSNKYEEAIGELNSLKKFLKDVTPD